jgi:hypothetical protein
MSIFLAPSNARIKNSRRANAMMLSERAIAQGLFVIVQGLFVIAPKGQAQTQLLQETWEWGIFVGCDSFLMIGTVTVTKTHP